MSVLTRDLPPYNRYSGCPKCGEGWSRITTRYTRLAFSTGEVLRRTCVHCGYSWDQRVKDENSN